MPARPAPRVDSAVTGLLALLGAGSHPVGSRLPPIRQLAQALACSIATIQGALDRLEDRGLVERRPRSGVFVLRAGDQPGPRQPPAWPSIDDPDLDGLTEAILAPVRPAGDLALLNILPADLLPRRRLAALARTRLGEPQWLTYADPAGDPRLRAAVARRLHGQGVPVAADDLIVTAGAMEGLAVALRILCRPGDRIGVESPTFFGILQLARELGLEVVELPTDPATGLDPDRVGRVLRRTPLRAVVAIPSYQNPTGACMPDDARRALVACLARHGSTLVEDDIYGDLAHGPGRPRPCRAFDPEGRTLLVGSVSKSLGPGLRIGWLVACGHAAAARRLLRTHRLGLPSLPQMLVADLLEQGGYERHLLGLRRILAARTAALQRAVVAHFPPDTVVRLPAGGLGLWVQLPPGTDALALGRTAAADGLLVAPGPLFTTGDGYRTCLRLGSAAYRPEHEPRIRHLGRLASHQLRRSRSV